MNDKFWMIYGHDDIASDATRQLLTNLYS